LIPLEIDELFQRLSFHDEWWEIIGGVILITIVFEKQDVF